MGNTAVRVLSAKYHVVPGLFLASNKITRDGLAWAGERFRTAPAWRKPPQSPIKSHIKGKGRRRGETAIAKPHHTSASRILYNKMSHNFQASGVGEDSNDECCICGNVSCVDQ